MPGSLRKLVFGISPRLTEFAERGFAISSEQRRERLEGCAKSFVVGYNLALEAPTLAELEQRLDAIPLEQRGFSYEGAGMGLQMRDLVWPFGAPLWKTFLAGPGAPYRELLHIGAGWAFSVMHLHPAKFMESMDTDLRWLVGDGYGFHRAFFKVETTVRQGKLPRGFDGYLARSFDHGVGRALWFIECADPHRLAQSVGNLAESRRADVWSGVGLASAFAGGVDQATLDRLVDAAGPKYKDSLFLGATLAAYTRERAGNLAPQTELACSVIGGITAGAAAAVVVRARPARLGGEVPPDPEVKSENEYEAWRQRIPALAYAQANRKAEIKG